MKWYEYDDTNVKPLPQRDIVSRAAYLLFYQRQNLTRNTINNLQTQKHWVFSVYGPPRSMQVLSSSPLEEEKSIVSSPSGGKNSIGRDYSEFYVERVRLENMDEQYKSTKQSRSKPEPSPDKLDPYEKEELRLLEELRLGINSPQGEQSGRYIPPPVESFGKDKSSPRREDMGINSPRQTVKHESPRKELFPNKTSATQNQFKDEINSKTSSRNKSTVAEKIAISRQSGDKGDSVMLSPRNMKNIYRRSDSVDSSKNSHSYTSGSEMSPTDSSPPSPLDEQSQTSSGFYQNQASNKNKSSNVLNNERDIGLMNGHVPNSVKLIIHSNQIHKDKTTSGSPSAYDFKRSSDNPPKTDNQKINSGSYVDKTPPRPDIFSTPQQVRKSPSPPVVVGRGWSTPQPHRKQYSDKPPMDRQFSVPPRVPMTAPPNGSQSLEIEGHAIGKQPQSLPVDVHAVTNKPPLPVKANQTVLRQSSEGAVSGRPTSAYSRASDFVDSRVPEYSPRPASAHTREPSYSDSRPVIISQRSEDQSSRGRSDLDVRKTVGRSEVRSRNRSADRQGKPLTKNHTSTFVCLSVDCFTSHMGKDKHVPALLK